MSHVRLPPPVPPFQTGDAALDAALDAAVRDEGGLARAIAGKGAALAAAFVPELLDLGETVWDDDEVDALPPKARAALKADAQRQYGESTVRKSVIKALLRELTSSPAGRPALRAAAAVAGSPGARGLIFQALRQGAEDADWRVLATALPEGAPWRAGMYGVEARLLLDPAYEASLIARYSTFADDTRMCVLQAVADRAAEPSAAWAALAVPELVGDVASIAVEVVARLPAEPALLDALLSLEPDAGGAVAAQLARFDEPRALARLADAAVASQLADDVVVEALDASRHPEAAAAAVAALVALRAAGEPKRRLKPYEDLAKKLAAKHGTAPPPKAAKAPSAPLPPEPIAPAPPLLRPVFADAAALEADMRGALDAAGLGKHAAKLLSPAAEVVAERVADEAAIPVGASKLGGLPDLPPGAAWPAKKKVAHAFVGQVRLAELAGSAAAALFPADGLLSFFIDDEDPEDYCQAGHVLYTPADALAGLVRTPPPASFQAARAGRPARTPFPACRVELVPTWRLAAPSNGAARKLEAPAYPDVHGRFAFPAGTLLLGFRDGYDGECPTGHRLLLQVASDDQAGFAWGDLDILSFFVPDKGLAAASFERVRSWVGE